MSDNPTLKEMISLAISAEREARAFYTGLAEKFSEHPDISDFWRGMMMDEEGHIREIEAIRESLSPDQLDAPENPELFHKVSEFLRFHAGEKLAAVGNLDEAYSIAVNLEYSEINKLMELMISKHITSNDHGARMRNSLEEHLGKIRNFPKRFGDSHWRRTIEAKE
jgi:hypothetical protein